MYSLKVLNYMLQNKDAKFLINNGLNDKKYFEGYEDEYNYVNDFIKNYGVTPDMTSMISRFPDFTNIDTNEPTEFLADKLQEEYFFHLVMKDWKNLTENLKTAQYKEAFQIIRNLGDQLSASNIVHPVDITTDTSRYTEYVEKTKNIETFYVTTGFKELDEALQGGWDRKNDLVTIVARPGQGKSWVLIKCALGAVLAGLRVGLYSGEMNENMVGYRFDTLLGNISNIALTRGQIQVNAEYKDYIDNFPKMVKGSLLVLTPEKNNNKLATVSDLQAFVERENLDMLCVDQYSLMEDEGKSKDSVAYTANLSKGLKRLQTLKQIPIITVSQQNRGKLDEDEDLDVSRIAQSDRIGQDSSVVIFLQNNYKDKIMTMSLAKVRNGVAGTKIEYKIDLNKGIFKPNNDDIDSIDSGFDKSKLDSAKFSGEEVF